MLLYQMVYECLQGKYECLPMLADLVEEQDRPESAIYSEKLRKGEKLTPTLLLDVLAKFGTRPERKLAYRAKKAIWQYEGGCKKKNWVRVLSLTWYLGRPANRWAKRMRRKVALAYPTGRKPKSDEEGPPDG